MWKLTEKLIRLKKNGQIHFHFMQKEKSFMIIYGQIVFFLLNFFVKNLLVLFLGTIHVFRIFHTVDFYSIGNSLIF